MFFSRTPEQTMPPPLPPPEPVNAILKRVAISLFLTLVAAVLTLGVGAIIVSEVWRFVSNMDEFKVDIGSPRAELPKWAGPAIVDDLQRTARLNGARSIFEPGLGRKIAAAYADSPWVVRVCYVKRVFPNCMEIGLRLREPAASVYVGDASYLVDREGVLLSRKFYQWPADEPALPFIIPAGRIPMCSPGMKWNEESVQAGMGLLRLLREYGMDEKFKIASIDLTNFRGVNDKKQSEVVIWNNVGTYVKWGRFAAGNRPGEVSDTIKLQNLQTVLNQAGADIANLEYIDVRWTTPTSRSRKEAAATRTASR